MVERARLENEYGRKAIEGSNPSLSATNKHPVTIGGVFVFLGTQSI